MRKTPRTVGSSLSMKRSRKRWTHRYQTSFLTGRFRGWEKRSLPDMERQVEKVRAAWKSINNPSLSSRWRNKTSWTANLSNKSRESMSISLLRHMVVKMTSWRRWSKLLKMVRMRSLSRPQEPVKPSVFYVLLLPGLKQSARISLVKRMSFYQKSFTRPGHIVSCLKSKRSSGIPPSNLELSSWRPETISASTQP